MNARRLPPEDPASGGLKIYTLGRFQVCSGEHVLFTGSGRYQKIWDLLMYLITYRGKHMAPENIIDTIWPDNDYDNPQNVLKNLVYRLKENLEQLQPGARTYIEYSYGGYGWNINAPYWLDADAFESLSQLAHALITVDPLQAALKYREALSLYQGHYLPESQHKHWVISKRHYYHRLFTRSVSELLAVQKEQRLFSQLVEDAEWALSIDNIDESINIAYMEALIEEGKTTQARDHYEYITALNYYESGSKPSPAMQNVYRAIKKRSEKAGPDFNDLPQMLVENDPDQGALVCDPDVFRLICRLERRRIERNKQPAQLGLLTFIASGLQAPAPERLKPAMDLLRGILLEGLRRDDVISPWDESQFIVLLPGLLPGQAENLLESIIDIFKDRSPQKDLILLSSVHSFKTPETPVI